ncbi:hypothetical protein [Bordetella sp. N]|uniref:hypothetical protein n=1 Tax=Bordetella sp. N TaxID=1746199 RepID=UPI0007088EDF|nr:hypothetical protein [Bordetella sp. N]ALM81627.1 hypothetical protein ASB57_00390 [Bordetella sp. N]
MATWTFRSRSSRPMHALPCLLLLAVILRALIPVGYMPDPAALREGMFRMSLCSAGGAMSGMELAPQHGGMSMAHASAMADMPGMHDMPGMREAADPATPMSHSGDHSAGTECPFWAAAHVALHLPPIMAELVLTTPRGADIPHEIPASLPPLPAVGPPLGPRAPPVA